MLRVLCGAGVALAAAQGGGAVPAAAPAGLTLSPRAIDGAASVLHLDVGVPNTLQSRASRLHVAFRCGAWP
jgi:hypothetical protein